MTKSARRPESLPRDFVERPWRYDVWQAYVMLNRRAPEAWGEGWSFGFPASLAFPAAEVEGLESLPLEDRNAAAAPGPRDDGGQDNPANSPSRRACGEPGDRRALRRDPDSPCSAPPFPERAHRKIRFGAKAGPLGSRQVRLAPPDSVHAQRDDELAWLGVWWLQTFDAGGGAAGGEDAWGTRESGAESGPANAAERKRQGGRTRENAGQGPTDWLRLDIGLPGLLGPGGPAPLLLSETAARETPLGNRALQEFLDLFQNRFMRLWLGEAAASGPDLGPAERDADDQATVCALALAGMLAGGLRNRDFDILAPGPPGVVKATPPDDAFLRAADLWAMPAPSAAGLETLLESCFGVKVKVEQFCGAWREMAEEIHTQVGSVNSRLGMDLILGKIVFSTTTGMNVHPSE